MFSLYRPHNLHFENINKFIELDPNLRSLQQLRYVSHADWWRDMPLDKPGIYILTGGRQIGKSTSCKLLMQHCLETKRFAPTQILYLPCDEIFDAKELSRIIRLFLDDIDNSPFLLIIDEITYVKDWDRTIKALADEGHFQQGLCLLTGSDTVILKEATQRFPGRRGTANQTDFHLYPLTFAEYVQLKNANKKAGKENNDLASLAKAFNDYLQTGGYLRAINDLAMYNQILPATQLTFEQWIRGDFLKQGKHEDILLLVLQGLLTTGVSQISYSALTEKIGHISKETCMDYCRLLNRMDILIELQAFDQNTLQGFPKKARKLHFTDPFIQRTIAAWLTREGYYKDALSESGLVEATVASHCHRNCRTYYFKGQGEVDVIQVSGKKVTAIEVKWANQVRPNDLKMLQHFKHAYILTKREMIGNVENIISMPVYQFLVE